VTSLDEALNALAPADTWRANWDDVVARASDRRVSRRLLVLAAALAVAVVVPLVALSAINDWWFFKYGAAPAPAHAPVVVKKGDWDGHRWQLVAYPSVDGGLCVSMNPIDEKGSFGAAMGCADLPITYLAGSPSSVLPAYVVGPVIAAAAQVRIDLRTGESLTVPTFAAAQPLERWRFYAARVDAAAFPRSSSPPFPRAVVSVAGLDAHGDVVACLVPAAAKDGISPLSACR
jgi:hypothetical protein